MFGGELGSRNSKKKEVKVWYRFDEEGNCNGLEIQVDANINDAASVEGCTGQAFASLLEIIFIPVTRHSQLPILFCS